MRQANFFLEIKASSGVLHCVVSKFGNYILYMYMITQLGTLCSLGFMGVHVQEIYQLSYQGTSVDMSYKCRASQGKSSQPDKQVNSNSVLMKSIEVLNPRRGFTMRALK